MTSILIVSVPGLRGDPKTWERMEAEFRSADVFPGATVKWLHYRSGITPFSRRSLADLACDLNARIHQEWLQHQGFDRVILTGHSMGALIARKAWLNAVDRDQGADYNAAPWGGKLERFVLFAGISRGVNADHPWWRRFTHRQFDWIPGRFTYEDCFRGSAFITNLRISWIRVISERGDQAPMMIQLLGTRDDLVAREDSIDLDVFPDAPPIYVPDASHRDVHWIEGTADPKGRVALFIEPFQRERTRGSVTAAATYQPRRVLMVVHGIRASRTDDWVKQAEAIVRARKEWQDVVVATPTYGYLSALRFVLPQVRRRYARYFRDFYTEVIAKYRNANVGVLCHSNGTYTLGQCLNEFSAIRVDRVALAGSVLPQEFDWTNLCSARRVAAVRSDSGSTDIPVAILCSALRSLFMRDVGPGGFAGFKGQVVREVRYHNGGHGAMLLPANLESMLAFVLDGQPAQPIPALIQEPAWMGRLSRFAGYLAWLIVAALVAAIVWGTLTWGWGFFAIAMALLILGIIALDVY